jgi:hypothetical protein
MGRCGAIAGGVCGAVFVSHEPTLQGRMEANL